MGQSCTPREQAGCLKELRVNAGVLEAFNVIATVDACAAHCGNPDFARQCGLGFCRAESSAAMLPCSCGADGGPCCCSQCEDAFGQARPLPVAQSRSDAAQPTLVLRPGHDKYNSQDVTEFHTVVRPLGGENVGENPLPTGAPSFVPPFPHPDSARSCTTAGSESSFEDCQFKTMVPVVTTRRPPSVPRLAIPGGVGVGTGVSASVSAVLKWPLEALSAASGNGAKLASGTKPMSTLQGSLGTSPSRNAQNYYKKLVPTKVQMDVHVEMPEPAKVSKMPAEFAERENCELVSNWPPQDGLVHPGSEETGEDPELEQRWCAEEALLQDDLLCRESSGLDMEALQHVQDYLNSQPHLPDELFGIGMISEKTVDDKSVDEFPPVPRQSSIMTDATRSARLGGA